MATIDLNLQQKWEEFFQRVEAGETLRVMRGSKEVAFIQPADVMEEDETFLDALAQLGPKQIADTFPADEFADWEKAAP